MSTRMIIVVGVIIVIGIGVWIGLRAMMNAPMYRPGALAEASLQPPAQQDDARWLVEEGIELHHFAQGEGRPILIIHGGPGYPYRQPWTGLEPLTERFRFHYYDQRGCGQSTRPIDTLTSDNTYQNIQTVESTLGLGAQLADIERIRQILGEERLILIGHSFGGFQAALYAAEFPEHVEALILVSPADVLVMPPTEGGLFEAVRERLPAEMHAEYDAYLADYLGFQGIFEMSEQELAAFNDQFGAYYAAAFDLPEVEQGEAGGWMVQAQYLSMGRRHDYRPPLAEVTAPTLVLHSSDDIQPEAVAAMYADALPNAQVAVIEGASHFPFEEQPQAFAEVVGAFLADVLD